MTHPDDSFDERPDAVGSVTFVGSTPGDLSLVTYAAARAIGQADLLVADSLEDAEQLSAAGIDYSANVAQVDEDEAGQLIAAVNAGNKVVRLYHHDLSGNAGLEATLARVLEEHRIRTHVIPGLTRWDSALLHGGIAQTATMATLDASTSVPDAWPTAETVVVWATPGTFADVIDRGKKVYGDDGEVLQLTGVGTTTQRSTLTAWGDLEALDTPACLIVGPGISEPSRRRLSWFEDKPLFDWDVLIPTTKDPVDELREALGRYGAATDVVPTLSIEPPRTEQAMEKAVRGIVDGRYLWLIFTSPHSVQAIMARLAEYGLDSRALSGILLAAVGRGTKEELLRFGLNPDMEPAGENTTAALAGEFPAFDDLIDPLNRVLVPTADVAVDVLVDGLARLGWEVEEVTAYRTVRAAPPEATMRERIKTGLFDAVVFTSSSSVRNMIGIAGKPHAASVIAAIGPATAQACEMHGLRVDVVADVPNVEFLAGGLATFAEQRRADRAAQGLPDTKPSQRKRRRRRKSA